MKWLLIICTVCIVLAWDAAPAPAKTMYVTDLTEITVRAGKGVDYKILATLKSGTSVDVVEPGRDWTQVRMSNGKSGWVVSRYLTLEKPTVLELTALKAAADQTSREISELKTENETLETQNQQLSQQVEALKQERTEARTAYETLKNDSADYLKLKGEYDRLTRSEAQHRQKLAFLEKKAADADFSKAIKWFLAGAGVLLIGIIIGASMKRKRSSLY